MLNICPFGLVSQVSFELTRISATVFETVSYTDSDTVTYIIAIILALRFIQCHITYTQTFYQGFYTR